jgi:hypothetical protein
LSALATEIIQRCHGVKVQGRLSSGGLQTVDLRVVEHRKRMPSIVDADYEIEKCQYVIKESFYERLKLFRSWAKNIEG